MFLLSQLDKSLLRLSSWSSNWLYVQGVYIWSCPKTAFGWFPDSMQLIKKTKHLITLYACQIWYFTVAIRGPFHKSNLRALLSRRSQMVAVSLFTIDCCLQIADTFVSPKGLLHAQAWVCAMRRLFWLVIFVQMSRRGNALIVQIVALLQIWWNGPLNLNNPQTRLYQNR